MPSTTHAPRARPALALLGLAALGGCGGGPVLGPPRHDVVDAADVADADSGDARPDAVSADVPRCAPGFVVCGDRCADLHSDATDCGACGHACDAGLVCADGSCVMRCPFPTQRCGASCVDLALDARNCGACGHACTARQQCSDGACQAAPSVRGPTFRVRGLGATGCASRDVEDVLGDDRGALGVAADVVYATGARASATFTLDALAPARTAVRRAPWLTSNLRDGSVYALANGTTLVDDAGGTVTTLLALDGPAVGTAVSVVPAVAVGPGAGLFAGYDRVAIHDGTRLYDVLLPSGAVLDFGPMPAPAHQPCAGGAGYFGTVEDFDGALYLDTVADATRVVRARVPDGVASPLATFADLGAMCGFALSLANDRWYFRAGAGGTQFGAGSATLGYCDATWDRPAAPNRYIATDAPASATWVDACASGVALLPFMDDAAMFVPLAFPLRYWSTMLPAGSPVNVTTNGFISLSGMMNASPGGSLMTGAGALSGVIAAHWNDLQTREGVCVATVGAAPARRQAFEWFDVSTCCGPMASGHMTFEVVLDESDGSIDMLYPALDDARPAATGLSALDGSDAVVLCDPPGSCPDVATGTRLRFVREAP